jgi:hypothetical protein
MLISTLIRESVKAMLRPELPTNYQVTVSAALVSDGVVSSDGQGGDGPVVVTADDDGK